MTGQKRLSDVDSVFLRVIASLIIFTSLLLLIWGSMEEFRRRLNEVIVVVQCPYQILVEVVFTNETGQVQVGRSALLLL